MWFRIAAAAALLAASASQSAIPVKNVGGPSGPTVEPYNQPRTNRADYVRWAEARLKEYDARASQLATARDRNPSDGSKYQDLDRRVIALRRHLEKARERLGALEAATETQWRREQSRVNQELSNARELARPAE